MRYFSFLLILLTGCVKYELPSKPIFDGRYQLNKVHVQDIPVSFYPPDTFVNNPNNEYPADWKPLNPLDTLILGSTCWTFEGMMLRMVETDEGWVHNMFYRTLWTTIHDPGYLEFSAYGERYIFKIIDSNHSMLMLRLLRDWNQDIHGYNDIILSFERIGP